MANAHISKRISFLTSVLTSWDGTEQRQAIRAEPRITVSYDYTGMNSAQSAWLRLLMYKRPSVVSLFPMWHAASPIIEGSSRGQKVIPVPLECLWHYRNIGAAMLWADDEHGGKAFAIKYITAHGSVGLVHRLADNWPKGVLAMPVFRGFLVPNTSHTARTGEITELTATFELLQEQASPEYFPEQFDYMFDEDIPEPWVYQRGLPARYEEAEVWRHEPQWVEDVDAEITKDANRVDYDTGAFFFDDKGMDSESREATYVFMSRQAANNAERFFWRHRGQWQSFWSPTWLHDMELVEVAPKGVTELRLRLLWYFQQYNRGTRRKTIVIFYRNETCEILKIKGYSRDDEKGQGVAFLEKPLTHTIDPQRIRMISFFLRVRFASDDLVMDYETTETTTAAITLKETNGE